MKIKRADGTIVDRKGQLTPADPPYKRLAPPKDIPSIVDRYIQTVGTVVHKLQQTPAEDLKPADIKNIIAMAKAVAMLQVIEVNKLASHGQQAVKDLPTEQIQALLAGAQQEPLDAEYTETKEGEDDEA